METAAIIVAIVGPAMALLIFIDGAIDELWWREWQKKNLPQQPR